MAVILRVVEEAVRPEAEHQPACLGCLLRLGLKVHVHPFPSLTVLYLRFHGIHACLYVQTTCHVHEEDVTAAPVGDTAFPYACRCLRNPHRLPVGIHADVLPDPFHQQGRVLSEACRIFGKDLLKEPLVGGKNHLTLYARTQLAASGIHVILQNVHRHIPQVLVAQCREQSEGTFQSAGIFLYESLDGLPVSTCLYYIRCSSRVTVVLHCLFGRERGDISMADGVLISQPACILFALCLGHGRESSVLGRRDDVHVRLLGNVLLVIEKPDGDGLVFPEGGLGISELVVLGCPDYHVALAGGEEGLPLSVRVFRCGRVELGVIVDLEVDPGIIDRLSFPVHYLEINPCRTAVVVDKIDFREVAGAQHHLLRAFIVAERTGVHEHGTGGRLVEPGKIEDRLGFAGTDEVPFPVCPGFHPGMVVIGMCPTGGIDLPGRNADGTEGSHGERALLSAAAAAGPYRLQGRGCARIGRLIGDTFVAPVVHFEYGILHGQALHPPAQFTIEDGPRAVERFVVHTHGQDEVPEEQFGYGPAPSHRRPCTQGCAHIVQVVSRRIVRGIGYGHIGIQEMQCLFLFGRDT